MHRKKVYMHYPTKVEEHAAKSQYEVIRCLVAKSSCTSEKTLKEMIDAELIEGDYKVLEMLYKNPKLNLDDDIRRKIVMSEEWSIRGLVLRDKKTSSKVLNETLREELDDEQEDNIVEMIMQHPNFKMEESTRQAMLNNKKHRYRVE